VAEGSKVQDGFRLEMGPDPTHTLDANQPLTRVPFVPTRRYFFDPKGKKLKNLTFLVEIFQTQTLDGWPDPI